MCKEHVKHSVCIIAENKFLKQQKSQSENFGKPLRKADSSF